MASEQRKIVGDFTHRGRRVALEEYPNGYLSAWLVPKSGSPATGDRLPVSTPRSKSKAEVRKAAKAFIDKLMETAGKAARERKSLPLTGTPRKTGKKKRSTPKRHKDVEFEVDTIHGRSRTNHDTFDAAASTAIALSASNGVKVNLDVLITSRSGARWWGGDYAVEEYNADPEASVSDRFVINVDPQGRIA